MYQSLTRQLFERMNFIKLVWFISSCFSIGQAMEFNFQDDEINTRHQFQKKILSALHLKNCDLIQVIDPNYGNHYYVDFERPGQSMDWTKGENIDKIVSILIKASCRVHLINLDLISSIEYLELVIETKI